eukprot:9658234-Alexandrium_andersonii.AAC.1
MILSKLGEARAAENRARLERAAQRRAAPLRESLEEERRAALEHSVSAAPTPSKEHRRTYPKWAQKDK